MRIWGGMQDVGGFEWIWECGNLETEKRGAEGDVSSSSGRVEIEEDKATSPSSKRTASTTAHQGFPSSFPLSFEGELG